MRARPSFPRSQSRLRTTASTAAGEPGLAPSAPSSSEPSAAYSVELPDGRTEELVGAGAGLAAAADWAAASVVTRLDLAATAVAVGAGASARTLAGASNSELPYSGAQAIPTVSTVSTV